MARTTGDTMAEGLQKVIQQLAALMALPDSDLPFLQGLQEAIATYIQQGAQSMDGGALSLPNGPGAGNPAGGMGGGMGMGGGPPMMAGPGIGGIAPPNPDELRRALSVGQG